MELKTILGIVGILLAGAFIVLLTILFLTGCAVENPVGAQDTEQSVTVKTKGDSTIVVHTEGEEETEVTVDSD